MNSDFAAATPDLSPAASPKARIERLWLASGLFLVTFAFYAYLTAPTITRDGDCGEMGTALWTLGIGHPTGYPVYCLAGRLFGALALFGEPAWRTNLWSAFTGAWACGLVACIIHRLTYRENSKATIWASIGGALLLAGFYNYGSQAIITEVYTLNGLIISWLILCMVAWTQDEDWRWFYTLALGTGLAMATHLSWIFLSPGLLYVALIAERRRFGGLAGYSVRLAGAILLFCAAAALISYLPLRSSLFPPPYPSHWPTRTSFWPFDWSHTADASGLIAHLTAKQFHSKLMEPKTLHLGGMTLHYTFLARSFPSILERMWGWLIEVAQQLEWMIVFIPVGIIAAFRKPALGFAFLLTVACNALEFGYKVDDQDNFFFPIYIIIGIWIGLGLFEIARNLNKVGPRLHWMASTGGAALLMTGVFTQWFTFVWGGSLHGSTIIRDLALAQGNAANTIEASAGKPVAVLQPQSTDDLLWPFWYTQFVLHNADHDVTPWERALYYMRKEGTAYLYVQKQMEKTPVVITLYDGDLAKHFSYLPIPGDHNGTAWLLSTQPLPPAATEIPERTEAHILGPNGLDTARIVRGGLWPTNKEGTVSVLHACLTAFNVDFLLPSSLAAPGQRGTGWSGTHQVGNVEMLVVPHTYYDKKTPPPGQQTIQSGDDITPFHTVTLEVRPLVIKDGEKPGTWLRARVPFNSDVYLENGDHDVWTRIVPLHGGEATPWTKTDRVDFVTK